MNKKVTLVGGAGTIGKILYSGLKDKYNIVVIDKKMPLHTNNFIQADATNLEQMLNSIPEDTDVLINLLNVRIDDELKNTHHFKMMTDIHFTASFYLFNAAIILDIPKVIFASSNHVTDYYEVEGRSLLEREITVTDYPLSRNLYGVLKLASENIGHILAQNHNLSVINLRIGSVPRDELAQLRKKSRVLRTLLSREDTIQLFDLAIQSTVKFGIYYGVSDNPGKPWSTENAWRELGYHSKVNSTDILKNQNHP